MFTFKQRWTSETLGDGRFDLGGFPLQVTACLLLRKLTISIACAGRGRHSEVLEAPDQVQRPQGCCCWLCARRILSTAQPEQEYMLLPVVIYIQK